MVLGREYLAQRVVIGPGGLPVPPVVADGSEAGHCFDPGGLGAPPMVADEAKLAIVFTYFFLRLSFFLLLLHLLLFTHFG